MCRRGGHGVWTLAMQDEWMNLRILKVSLNKMIPCFCASLMSQPNFSKLEIQFMFTLTSSKKPDNIFVHFSHLIYCLELPLRYYINIPVDKIQEIS